MKNKLKIWLIGSLFMAGLICLTLSFWFLNSPAVQEALVTRLPNSSALSLKNGVATLGGMLLLCAGVLFWLRKKIGLGWFALWLMLGVGLSTILASLID